MAPKMLKSQRGLKNQSHWIDMKPGPDRSARRPNSNSMDNTQILVHMLKIFMVKFLVKLHQVVVTNEATIW